MADECLTYPNCANGTIGVLLGNGDGTFQTAVTYNAPGEYAQTVAIGDVNGDGKPDVVVGSNCFSCGESSVVGILLGNGDGTFRAGPLFILPMLVRSIAVEDVDGDGKLDVLAGGDSSQPPPDHGVVSSSQGNEDGTFQSAVVDRSGGPAACSVAVSDVNGDGQPDLVGANCAGNTAGVLINNTAPKKGTTTAVISSGNPSLVGQGVTFTATVTSTAGTPPNGETITFKNGSATMGTAALSGGAASLTVSSLPVGTFPITATYPGDADFATRTSPVLLQVVNSREKSATSTTLTSNLNPAAYGQSVTFAAAVTNTIGTAPTGKVSFTWGIYTIGTATLNSSGVATLTKSLLNANTYPLVAVYKGDTSNLGSTSSIVNQVVQQTTTTAKISSSPNPSAEGQAVTFTATISSPTVRPTGPVTFTVGKTVLGTAQLVEGKAKLTISSLPVGSTKVTATYYGNSNIAKSSASVAQTVQ